jgi:hypothetical protein
MRFSVRQVRIACVQQVNVAGAPGSSVPDGMFERCLVFPFAVPGVISALALPSSPSGSQLSAC